MERYYVPAGFPLTDDTLFAVSWVDGEYIVFNGCPNREQNIDLDYIKVTKEGYTVDVGTTNVDLDSKLLVGEGCASSEYNISTVSASRSLLDVPFFSAFEPIYFLGFLVFSIFLFVSAVKLFFGRGWK